MEEAEKWKSFLGKKVQIIINDPPSPIPVNKIGVLQDVTTTHLILKINHNTEALLLTNVRRVEIK